MTKLFRSLFLIAVVTILSLSAVATPAQAKTSDTVLGSAHSAQVTATTITYVAFAPKGGYAILFDKYGYSTKAVPNTFNDKLKEYNGKKEEILSFSFTSDGGWVIVTKNNVSWLGIPKETIDKIKDLSAKGNDVKQVVFGPKDEWLILVDQNGYSSVGLAKGIVDNLKELNSTKDTIKQLSFTPDGDYVLLYGKNGYYWSKGIPKKAQDKLAFYNDDKQEIFSTAFGEDGAWAIISEKEVSWGDTTDEFAADIKGLLGGK